MSNPPSQIGYEIVPAPSADIRPLIPWALVGLRLLLCPVILAGAWAGWNGALLAIALAAGVASDIFDGIVARRLGVATPRLRRADSTIDVLFWLSVLIAAQISAGFVTRHRAAIALLLASEALCQIVSQRRFHRPPATHTYAAKAWGLWLFAGFALVFLFRDYAPFSLAMLAFGVLVNIEVVAIMLLSPRQPIDVASVWRMPARRSGRSGRSAMLGP